MGIAVDVLVVGRGSDRRGNTRTPSAGPDAEPERGQVSSRVAERGETIDLESSPFKIVYYGIRFQKMSQASRRSTKPVIFSVRASLEDLR